ncbi:MAG: translation initiation factor IF-2 [Candidatus Hatepunaea meridiana]|nr:translation initiation factor IF-2 [Candidatus Hatepunaea meridiana]
MIEGFKQLPVYKLARELRVETQTIVEHLDSLGYDMVRKKMTLVIEEMYVECLKKFDRAKFIKHQSEQVVSLKEEKQRDTQKLREEELDKIIATKDVTKEEKKKKFELPKSDGLSVIDEPAKPKTVEIPSIVKSKDIPETEIKPDKKKDIQKETRSKKKDEVVRTEAIAEKRTVETELTPEKEVKDEKDVKEKKPEKIIKDDVVTEKPKKDEKRVSRSRRRRRSGKNRRALKNGVVEEAKKLIRAVDEGKTDTSLRLKVELPKVKPLKVIEQAPVKKEPKEKEVKRDEPFKKPARKRLKRKRVETEDDKDKKSAVDTKVQSKLLRETEDQKKQRTKGKKAGVATAIKPDKKRKRRRKSKTDAPTVEIPKGKTTKRRKVDEKEVAATIKQTFAQITGAGKQRRHHIKGHDKDVAEGETSIIKVTEYLTTLELSNVMEIPVQDVIKRCLEMGMLISINQRLDADTIELLTAEFDIEVEFVQEEEIEAIEDIISDENLSARSPVVTIMGHVDHGKTTLLDYLRRTKVAEGEAGGITQHIGAYEVDYNGAKITFLDTPGHEAFTAMRARGAQVTDIVVLVIAADNRVMPQTLEAIDHARNANVPIIIAVNKIDKPSVDVDAIYTQLSDYNILVEKWGGKYQAAEISAKFGKGINNLLDEIVVAADVLDLKANPDANARGVVIESRLDKGLGAVATILIQNGTLKIGEPFVIGQYFGKVRSMYNEFGDIKKTAGPATPMQVVGFDGIPQAGDRMLVFNSEKEAREVSQRRQRQYREISMRQITALTLDQVNRQMREMEMRELPLIIKGDVHGSVEVISDSLMKLSTSEVKVEIIRRGVGGISESDVLLAAASQGIIIGFHVHPNSQARETARREGVECRLYRVIHELIDDVRNSLEGLLAPSKEEVLAGSVEVRKIYKISRVGIIAGCYVTDGKVNRKNKVRLIRDDVEIWTGNLDSLKRYKDDAHEVVSGFECGLSLTGYNDIRIGDRVESFEVIETMRKLDDSV